MSGYEYHEFRAVDRALTQKEQAEVARLSSRANVGPYHAVFVYHYSYFRGDADALLMTHFDALFFMDTPGQIRLVFAMPANRFDVERVKRYGIEEDSEYGMDFLWGYVEENRAFVDFQIHIEEDWLDGEGWLARLLPLREALLRGDDRFLYLCWLVLVTRHGPGYELEGWEDDEGYEEESVPIPPGMQTLDAAHHAFLECFWIDKNILKAASAPSVPLDAQPGPWVEKLVGELSHEEALALLLRVAHGEGLDVERALNQRAEELRPAGEGGRPLCVRKVLWEEAGGR